jgi:hypothetical protein
VSNKKKHKGKTVPGTCAWAGIMTKVNTQPRRPRNRKIFGSQTWGLVAHSAARKLDWVTQLASRNSKQKLGSGVLYGVSVLVAVTLRKIKRETKVHKQELETRWKNKSGSVKWRPASKTKEKLPRRRRTEQRPEKRAAKPDSGGRAFLRE